MFSMKKNYWEEQNRISKLPYTRIIIKDLKGYYTVRINTYIPYNMVDEMFVWEKSVRVMTRKYKPYETKHIIITTDHINYTLNGAIDRLKRLGVPYCCSRIRNKGVQKFCSEVDDVKEGATCI